MKKLLLSALVLVFSSTANAEWVYGAGYVNMSDEGDGIDISLGAVAGSVGYVFDNETFRLVPELRVGFGLSDDDVRISGVTVDVEIESFLALSVMAQLDLGDSVYVYAQPSYANLEIEASSGGFSESDSEWEFGLGAGLGFRVSETASVELGYETYDGLDVFAISLKFRAP